MRDVKSAANLGRRTERSGWRSFRGVFLVAAFAAVGSTIPLFNIYRAEDGFTNAGISMTVVAYSVAAIGTLLVLRRLSNHVGRRPAAFTSLGLLVLGCLVQLNVTTSASSSPVGS